MKKFSETTLPDDVHLNPSPPEVSATSETGLEDPANDEYVKPLGYEQFFEIVTDLRDNYDELTQEKILEYLKFLDGKMNIFKYMLKHNYEALTLLRILQTLCRVRYDDQENPLENVITRFAFATLEKLTFEIEQAVQQKVLKVQDVIGFYGNVPAFGDANQLKNSITGLVAHINIIIEDLKDPSNYFYNSFLIKKVLDFGDDAQRSAVYRLLFSTIESCKGNKCFPCFIGVLLKNTNTRLNGEELVLEFLNKHQLPANKILSAWFVSGEPEDMSSIVKRNMEVIFDLEEKEMGICQFLYEKFGIADFDRYPIELLLTQFREYERIDKPYGIIIYPRNDWNGAFYSNKNMFKDLMEQLGNEFGLIAIECESKIDIARALINLDDHHNPPNSDVHKIEFLILGGHGEPDRIYFGDENARCYLTSEDLVGKGVQRTSEFFVENPTFILVSCETGTEGGIGPQLSITHNAEVNAPSISTSISRIDTEKINGKLKLTAHYYKDLGNNVFLQGKSVNPEVSLPIN